MSGPEANRISCGPFLHTSLPPDDSAGRCDLGRSPKGKDREFP